ncbi:MAG: patatin-like phospholipase family protein [Microthrixaceae bacterium]
MASNLQEAVASQRPGTTAFVLGGGGKLGTAEVGMLEALAEHGIIPDLVLGTSIGAINGAAVAADPSVEGVGRLRDLWTGMENSGVFGGSMIERLRHIAAERTSLHSNFALRTLLEHALQARKIEDLPVRFECVAACIETASEHWFSSGSLVEAVLASSALPGLLPAVQVGGLHYLDGGIVDSIPLQRAVDLGTQRIFVLQVGRIEQPLTVPKRPHEVALVAFEISRRRSFTKAMEQLPAGVEVHVLPTGHSVPQMSDLRQFRYRDFSEVQQRMILAKEATLEYLDSRGMSGTGPE